MKNDCFFAGKNRLRLSEEALNGRHYNTRGSGLLHEFRGYYFECHRSYIGGFLASTWKALYALIG